MVAMESENLNLVEYLPPTVKVYPEEFSIVDPTSCDTITKDVTVIDGSS
jgi:hypothetical protein